MIQPATIRFLALLACMGASGLGFAEGRLTHHVDQLRCGNITARLRTTCVEQISVGWECVSQSLQLISRDGIPRDIPLDIRAVQSSVVRGLKALDGYVADWACVRSQWGQHYLDLGYSCRAFGDDCGTLSPSGEWEQFLDMSGHVVAGGRNGIEPGLLGQLGLGKLLRNALPITGVGPNK